MIRRFGIVVMLWAVTCPSFALTIATWNFEWLTLKGDQRAGDRGDEDYHQLASVFEQLSPDVLAFQEVDSPAALARVVPSDQYTYYFSDRYPALRDKPNSQQLTGIAVRNGWTVSDPKDLRAIALPSFFGVPALRYATYVIITPPDQAPFHMLSVHLKSGCFHQSQGTRSCDKLNKQMRVLADWVSDRHHAGEHVVVAGDFNRYIGESDDAVWRDFQARLVEKSPTPPHLINVTASVRARCKARRYNHRTQSWNQVMYNRLVDHILVSEPLVKQWQYSYQHHFDYHTVMRYRLSDHCPVVAQFTPPATSLR